VEEKAVEAVEDLEMTSTSCAACQLGLKLLVHEAFSY
jgi:hypothetical protein